MVGDVCVSIIEIIERHAERAYYFKEISDFINEMIINHELRIQMLHR